MLERFATFLDQYQTILLTTHENPDGDGIGALIGLAHYLRHQGKNVRTVVCPKVPDFLAFIDPSGWLEPFDGQGIHADLAQWPEAWILVDASEPARLGKMLPLFEASNAVKACLDHHLKDAPMGFHHEFTDAGASASAELVATLAYARMPKPLPQAMARALYAGIVDDTGNFRFSNATPVIHRLAAQLIEDGAEPARIYQALYHQGRPERVKVHVRALDGMALMGDGRYARLTLSRADMVDCGAVHEDLEGLVNKPLELRGVEVSCLLEELEDGRVKASLRSRERVNVNAVARCFGGGGHFLASGAKLDGPVSRAQTDMDRAILGRIQEDLPNA